MKYLVSYTSPYYRKNTLLLYRIKSFDYWTILNDNTFIIDTPRMTAQQLFDKLRTCCSTSEKLIVLTVMQPVVHSDNTPNDQKAWMISHLDIYESSTHRVKINNGEYEKSRIYNI